MARLRERFQALDPVVQQLAIAGLMILAGVPLVLTGSDSTIVAGGLFVVAGLLVARFGQLLHRDAPEPKRMEMSSDRRSHVIAITVGLLFIGGAAMLGVRLFGDEGVTSSTIGRFCKGLLALAMMSTLGLWFVDTLPRRLTESRLGGSRLFRSAPPPSEEAASLTEDPAGQSATLGGDGVG